MNIETYRHAIARWCAATGMEAWDAESEVEVEIGGTPVALVYDARTDPAFLSVYCDLGVTPDEQVMTRLLEANLRFEAEDSPSFAIHSGTETVIYRLRIALGPQTDGATLPARIAARIETARSMLQ